MRKTATTKEQIVDTESIGIPPPPSGGSGVFPDAQPRPYDLRADPTQEYVAGGYFAPLGDYLRALPKWIDPVQRDFGLDIYDRMAHTDPQVASCIDVFKAAVLADGWRLSPAQDTDETVITRPGVTRKRSSLDAEEACNLCKYALGAGLHKTPFDLFLRQMLDALYQGHKLSEIVLRREESGPWAGRLVIDRLKPKAQRSTAFALDTYDNLIGILGILPNVPFFGLWPAMGFLGGAGLSLVPSPGADSLQKDAPSLLPRSKFALLTWDGQDGNPQGRSLLRRAYAPWWWKQHGYAIWGKFIAKHADPSVVGTAAEGSMPVPDPLGRTDPKTGLPLQITPVQAMSQILAAFQNGTFMSIPHGATVDVLNAGSNGEAISLFMEWCNKEIAKAILGQTLATEEGKHASRAQASVHEGSKDDVTRYGQVLLTNMVLGDVLRTLILQNYGTGSEHLIPEFGLGQEETMSYTEFATGTSGLVTSGYLHDSQYVALDAMGGLPPRDPKQWAEELKQKKEMAEQALMLGDKAAQETPGDKGGEGQAVVQKAD